MYAKIIENKITEASNYDNGSAFIDFDYNIYIQNPDKYIYQEGEVAIDPDYETKQAQKEQERIAQLHLTRGDVFRGLYQAKQVTRAQLRAIIEAMPEGDAKEMALIDFDEALDFYRGNALIDVVGATLEITPAQMTAFFETGDYSALIGS